MRKYLSMKKSLVMKQPDRKIKSYRISSHQYATIRYPSRMAASYICNFHSLQECNLYSNEVLVCQKMIQLAFIGLILGVSVQILQLDLGQIYRKFAAYFEERFGIW